MLLITLSSFYNVAVVLSGVAFYCNCLITLIFSTLIQMAQGTASATATSRLSKEYKRLLSNPVPLAHACPLPSNILEWHYVLEGSPGTPYEGGYYYGKLIFPPDFPFKPPSIYMTTPSGRFLTDTRLCLSISDYHPETWNPSWCVSTIIVGLHSFMNENAHTVGSTTSTDEEKRILAKRSGGFNIKLEVRTILKLLKLVFEFLKIQ
uniref:UBIQUITIN_CONJUGAT_2 domain-containing protein n=1 Tax=Steinernema glaseri TaxID=37863 RepID=A0A1I7Z2N7_9BILA